MKKFVCMFGKMGALVVLVLGLTACTIQDVKDIIAWFKAEAIPWVDQTMENNPPPLYNPTPTPTVDLSYTQGIIGSTLLNDLGISNVETNLLPTVTSGYSKMEVGYLGIGAISTSTDAAGLKYTLRQTNPEVRCSISSSHKNYAWFETFNTNQTTGTSVATVGVEWVQYISSLEECTEGVFKYEADVFFIDDGASSPGSFVVGTTQASGIHARNLWVGIVDRSTVDKADVQGIVVLYTSGISLGSADVFCAFPADENSLALVSSGEFFVRMGSTSDTCTLEATTPAS